MSQKIGANEAFHVDNNPKGWVMRYCTVITKQEEVYVYLTQVCPLSKD